MSKAKKVPIGEQCEQALEHYLKLSSEACHYNSLIPKAIEFYRRMHIPHWPADLFYEEPCEHKELEEVQEMASGKMLFKCKECPHLFVVDSLGEDPREPTVEDFRSFSKVNKDG